MYRHWRLPCPNCDTGYRKSHTEIDAREAARALDQPRAALDDDATFVRCNNCRAVHPVEETRDLDVQGGVGR